MTLAGVNYGGGLDSVNRAEPQIISAQDIWVKVPPEDEELGSAFGWNDRMFYGFRDGMVFDYGDYEARDVEGMLKKGSKASQIEKAMSLPIMSAKWNITGRKGDKGEAEFINAFWDADPMNGGSSTTLDEIIALNTSAFAYKRAYWELVYTRGTGDFEGKTVYSDVAWRPQTTCRLAREQKTGRFAGFEQDPFYTGVIARNTGPIYIPVNRAYVYLHGKRRNPLSGTSDLEVTYWCYKTTQKLLFLWFQFLEGVSLPRTIVRAQDMGDARKIAQSLAQMRSSGVLPIAGAKDNTEVSALDLSGKGAEQFLQAINWLDQTAVNSVLAGFLNLTGAAANGLRGGGGGSYALSRDASDFFLQTREADAREIERSIREDLFGPLIRYNFGPAAIIPDFKFEPLNAEDKSPSVSLLQALLASQDPAAVPSEFIGELASQVATYLGMDGDKVQVAFEKAGAQVAAQKAAQEKAKQQQMTQGGAPVPGLPPEAAKVGGAVDVAHAAITGAQADKAGAKMTPTQTAALRAIQGK